MNVIFISSCKYSILKTLLSSVIMALDLELDSGTIPLLYVPRKYFHSWINLMYFMCFWKAYQYFSRNKHRLLKFSCQMWAIYTKGLGILYTRKSYQVCWQMEAKCCHDCTFQFTDYAEQFHKMSFKMRINQPVFTSHSYIRSWLSCKKSPKYGSC